ncbi:MAG: hypothetical protein MJE12_08025, partial [Alphaproteobacteria bacterium]|nr:hypothetical protein [Alphaproteobacteria bacterium]
MRGIVVEGPDAASLARGQVLEGRVVSQANGLLVLRTAQGPITVQTGATPPDGALVLIRVQSEGARPNVLLLPQTAPATAAADARAGAAGRVPTATAALTQGDVFRAVVTATGATPPAQRAAGQAAAAQGTAAPNPAAPAPGSPLQAGATVAFRVLGLALPGSTAAL